DYYCQSFDNTIWVF
nr:immunoglobulin light chain junction region [Macaca mulatta]MOX12751.1 immunoglobulin light chain junction region [Macaca mulatta]MOX12773.1 immunoglobulin light chain junction region [Macaca mulatta]MOX13963.1 immunoglobulin light chain junction region [Macaca mulatta]